MSFFVERSASAASSAGGAASVIALLAIVNLLKFLWCLRLERRASNQWLQIQGPVGAVSQKYDYGSKPLKTSSPGNFSGRQD